MSETYDPDERFSLDMESENVLRELLGEGAEAELDESVVPHLGTSVDVPSGRARVTSEYHSSAPGSG